MAGGVGVFGGCFFVGCCVLSCCVSFAFFLSCNFLTANCAPWHVKKGSGQFGCSSWRVVGAAMTA